RRPLSLSARGETVGELRELVYASRRPGKATLIASIVGMIAAPTNANPAELRDVVPRVGTVIGRLGRKDPECLIEGLARLAATLSSDLDPGRRDALERLRASIDGEM